MQMDQDKLKTENGNILAALREKTKKHQQTQELYDRLKRKEMTAATQSAAYDSVEEVLQSAAGRQGEQGYQWALPLFNHLSGNQHPLGHQKHGRSGSGGSGSNPGMMPPPPRRSGQSFVSQALGIRENTQALVTDTSLTSPRW